MSNVRQKRGDKADNRRRCANCFVCKQDTELCPLADNYDPDAYLKWEAKYLARRGEKGTR